MARLPRLSVAGHVHYLVQRGHNRQAIFLDDDDRRRFLTALGEAAAAHRLALHAYVLLDDQIQILATPPTDEAVGLTMQALGRRYVTSFNQRHGRTGSLWDGRFKGTVVDAGAYLLPCICLIESLPARRGLVGRALDWPWSSLAHHLGLRADPLVSDHALFWSLGNTPFDREAAYRAIAERGLTSDEIEAIEASVLKGWPLGDDGFRHDLAKLTDRPLAPRPRGRPPRVRVG